MPTHSTVLAACVTLLVFCIPISPLQTGLHRLATEMCLAESPAVSCSGPRVPATGGYAYFVVPAVPQSLARLFGNHEETDSPVSQFLLHPGLVPRLSCALLESLLHFLT